MPATRESANIHPTATIDPSAEIADDITIGAGAIIGPHCRIGAGTRIGPNVLIIENTTIGESNQIHAGAVLGGEPQDRAYDPDSDRGVLIIGDHNVIREFVTMHRGAGEGGPTRIGSHCFLMANAHVGHNAIVGDRVTLTNGAVLAGHARVGERAILSAFSAVHQFCEVGEYAMFQATAVVSQHVPPFCIVHRSGNQLSGINTVGMRRSGKFSRDQISEVREVYRRVFRSASVPSVALRRTSAEPWSGPARRLIEFLEASYKLEGRRARGVCTGAARAIRALRQTDDDES